METPSASTVGKEATQTYKKFKNGMDNLASEAKDFDLQEQYGVIKDRAAEAYDSSIEFVKKYPLSSLLGATAVGYIAASLFRSRD